MSSLPLIIVNPASAKSATASNWPGLASTLRTHFGPFNCAFTKAPGDAKLIAEAEAQQGRRLIVACGGDGTISEVANGIIESGLDVELGILPSGTGGDFRRTLRIPSRTADAALLLRKGHSRRIDVGRIAYINHQGREDARYFLGVASFGLSGEVIERVKNAGATLLPAATRRLGGKLNYGLAMLQTTLASENKNVWVQIGDGRESRMTVANLCVANARFFGGGMKIAPEAKLNDGRFDIVTIGDLSALEILTNSYKLYAGTHLGIERVYHTHATRITARPAEKDALITIEVDGELPGRLPATFEIMHNALTMRCP
jgi:diacylglycerol kinase (ATP)